MPVVKKNKVKKKYSKEKSRRTLATIDDDIWFPEQLAKVNALLEKAILFPHVNNKKISAAKPQKKSKAGILHKVKDYGKDPFFVKKTKQSKEFLEKHGFPKERILKK